MNDLDKWWVWSEEDIPRVMSGRDIVRMYLDRWSVIQNAAYPVDEDIVSYHRLLHWAVEAPRNKSQNFSWCVPDE